MRNSVVCCLAFNGVPFWVLTGMFAAIGIQATLFAQEPRVLDDLLLIPGYNDDGSYASIYRMQQIVEELRDEGRVDDDVVTLIRNSIRFVESGTRDHDEQIRMASSLHERFDGMTQEQWLRHLADQEKRARAVMEELRNAVGPAIWAEIKVRHNAVAIKNSLRFQKELKDEFAGLPFSFRSFLLKNVLDLKTSQWEAMEKLERQTLKDLHQLDDERVASIRKAFRSCYDEMLNVLDSRQRKAFKELYGSPLVFTELASGSTWETLAQFANWNGYVRQSYKQPVGSKAPKAALGIDYRNPVPDEVDIVLFELIREPLIWSEIEASKEQIAGLKKLSADIAANADLTNATSKQRMKGLLLGEFDDAGLLGDMLLDHQLAWLRQAELQLRLWTNRGSFGLLSPELSSRLDLDSDQKAKISKIANEQFAKRIREANASYAKQYLELALDLVMKETELLDDAQRGRLAKYLDISALVTELSKSETSRLKRMNQRDLWNSTSDSRRAQGNLGGLGSGED